MRQKTWNKVTETCITIAKFFLSVIKFANGANAFVSRGLWTIVYFLFFNLQFYFIDFSVDCLSERGKAKGVYPGMFLLLSLNSCLFFSPLPLLSVFHDWCVLLCPVFPFVLFLFLDKRFMSCCHFAFLCFQWFIFIPKMRTKKFEEQM